MLDYGLWPKKLVLGEKEFPVEDIEPSYVQRAGLQHIIAVNGLPDEYVIALVTAAQVCDIPHTWCVRRCSAESEVTADILDLGLRALAADREQMNAHIIAYLGLAQGENSYRFLAAGAIRDKLTRDYRNEEFPVVSRAVVAPAYRGKGLGSLIVEHRMKAAFHYFKKRPKAIHFGTESEKILTSIKRIEREKNLRFVHIGNERYTSVGGTHTVTDYLCFLPWYQEELLNACDTLNRIVGTAQNSDAFRDKLRLFMTQGVSAVSGAELENLYRHSRGSSAEAEHNPSIALLDELFFVKHKIGAEDPVPGSG
jgi:GNAT superfamily N-acetyltransferase